jgi:hypothetical protein
MTMYIWTGKTVITSNNDTAWERFDGHFLYDPNDVPSMQWGKNVHFRWAECTREEVPKEFLATLLLMGIPT